MTQDEIIAMARQVGYPIQHPEWQKATEEFAALVAAKEREACAKVFEAEADTWIAWQLPARAKRKGADAIRARGQA
jgi:hypothetical protein